MNPIRIDLINIIDSSNIEVTFTSKLSTSLNTGNVQIISESANTPNSEVLSVKVLGNVLKIYCQPLTPYSIYNLTFRSTISSPFISLNGEDMLLEDGVSNIKMISGPPETENIFRDLFKNYLKDNIYNVDSSSSIVSKLIESYSSNLIKCLADLLQIRNENYISNLVENEIKVRGFGPFDRLNEGGAYEIVRVANTPSGDAQYGGSGFYQVNYFPSYPFSLQSTLITKEILEIDSINLVGKFNINSLILNVKNNPVIKLNNITFILNTSPVTYTYPIEQFGYQLVDNRYDQEYCFNYYNLETNQIKLNDILLKEEIIDLESIIRIEVDYEYKDLGKLINNETVTLSNVLVSSRETIPSIINIFDLKHAPIVDANNSIPEISGVVFSNPDTANLSSPHPAFLKEIPFRLEGLPYLPGQYSVDYANGRVYVYGEDSSNTGTGNTPPVATYKYRFQYQKDIDYSFDQDQKDLSALPNGNLIDNQCRINFKYEKVLIPDVDYVCKPHREVLQERVANRLLDLGSLKVLNKPVTNVFRIYNETSGEIYTPIRWSQDKIYYSYNSPPKIKEFKFERARFELISNELLTVTDIFNNIAGNKIFKIYLNNNQIVSKSEDCIASSFNSSLSFSKTNIFSVEKYTNKNISNPENILTNIGDYCVDYVNGIIYCAVSSNQNNDLGFASYNISKIKTSITNILSVDDIYYQVNPLLKKNKNFNYSSFDDSSISVLNLDSSDEMCYKNDLSYPYQLFNTEVGYFDTQNYSEVVTVQPSSYDSIGGNLFTNQEITYKLGQDAVNPNTFSSSIPGVTFNPLDGKITIPIGTQLNFSLDGFNIDSVRLIAYYSYYTVGFQNKVGENIKDIRSLFEYEDLLNNIYPLNFATSSTYQDRSITVNSLNGSFYDKILEDENNNLYIYLPYKSTYISPNLNFVVTIKNANTSTLYSIDQILGDGKIKIILSSTNSPSLGDLVKIDYSIKINNLSRIALDYDKGGFYTDYSVVSDELIVSYECGEDVIDFRQSKAIAPGSTYYVSYKVGAMRDALLNNFGSLLNIQELNEFNINLEREKYRDCISGALSSFLQGPTVSAIKNLVSKITHTQPEIVESLFNNWSLGDSLLHPNSIKTTGEFSLVPLKFNNGALINQEDQSISLPQSSNLSFKQGTFETWIMPEWDGIDNNAELSVSITKNGIPIANDLIFTGLNQQYPTLVNNTFTLNKQNCLFGTPQRNKNGVYIYYAPDSSGLFNRWYVEIIDNGLNGIKYSIQISSLGKFYDVKNVNLPDANISTTTLTNKITIRVNNVINKQQIITFICDKDQYLVDSGEEVDRNRFSLYKDASGYLNFKIIDNNKNTYAISHDVSDWKRNDKHFVATSWKLNSENGMDELHLFVDGLEVPNSIKYGQKLLPYPHQKFKTINPEVITGFSNVAIIGGKDLSTNVNGTAFTSTSLGAYLNVQDINILYVEDPLFDPNGYLITNINGNNIEVDGNFPASLNNLKFSINKTSFNLKLDAAVYSNISVSTISSIYQNTDLQTTANSEIVTSFDSNFDNITPGFILKISGFDIPYTILSSSGNSLSLDRKIEVTSSNLNFKIYSNVESELSGQRSLNPDYFLSLDNYFNSVLTVTNGVGANDILILNTYGLNFQTVKTKHYVWSNQANTINARLPSPISTNSVKITKIIDAQYVSTGSYYTESMSQPSVSDVGRDLVATLSGSGAIFSTPITITIDGYSSNNTYISQEVHFNDYGKLDFSQKMNSINSIQVDGAGKFAFEIKEKYPVTYNDDGYLFAAIKCSYNLAHGFNLERLSNDENNNIVVADYNQFFSKSFIGNTLTITNPFVEHYKILDVSNDGYRLTLDGYQTSVTTFNSASYVVRYTLDDRSGIRNGKFIFEQFDSPATPYYLNQGSYEIEYQTYLSIKIDPSANENIYFGSDFKSKNQANAVLDQIKIFNICLQDTRVKEVIPANQRSITKDFNSLIPLKADRNTLVLIDFNTYPFVNAADFYITNSNYGYFQSDNAINNYFNNSLLIKDKHIVLDNYGILDSNREATIEFWVNPIYDTQNDPSFRYYFDAYGAKTIKAVSLNNSQVKINENISEILSVTLENGDSAIDYFAGGNVTLSNTGAIEAIFDLTGSGELVTLPNQYPPAFQIISVRLEGDFLNKDYFGNGVIDKNNQRNIYLENAIFNGVGKKVIVTYKPINGASTLNTQIINLNKKLPKDNSSVIVKFIPKGFKGDRISIYKDPLGYLNFKIFGNNKMHTLFYKINWSKGTWHRVKASFRVNTKGSDEMRLFIDGFEISDQFSQNRIRNGSYINRNISLTDTINQVNFGGDFSGNNRSYCLLNNLRISNISRPVYKPYGQSIDVSYGTNLDAVFPVTKDTYTTYLLDIDNSIIKNDNFASIILKDSNNFNFGVNIFDSFGIVNENPIIKQILEKLIKNLKPANSKAYINYS